MDSRLMRILDRLIAASAEAGWPLDEVLQPGLRSERIETLEQRAGIVLPEILRDLHAWRDGSRKEREAVLFFPDGRYLSLTEAFEVYREQLAMAQKLADATGIQADKVWDRSWFPLFEDQGDYHLVMLSQDASSEYPVYFLSNEERRPLKRYPSLQAFLEIIGRCFVNGAYLVDGEGELQEQAVLSAAVLRDYLAERGGTEPTAQTVRDRVALLSHGDGGSRGDAAAELIELKDPKSVAPLSALLANGDDTAKTLAARILGEIGKPETANTLVDALADPTSAVRGASIEALGKLKAKTAIPALKQILQGNDVSLQAKVLWALGEIGADDCFDIFSDILRSPHLPNRIAAVNALMRVGDRRAVAPLTEALDDPQIEVGLLAASALGRLGERSSVEALRGFLEHLDSSEVAVDDNDVFAPMRRQQIQQARKIAKKSIETLENGK